ncbi:MAG TPA: cell division protein SepF [Oculatellaceae cyanobacterium]
MPFNLFHKKKQPEQQTLSPTAQEQPEQQPPVEQSEAPVEAAPAAAPEAQPESSVPVEAPTQELSPEPAPTAEEHPQEAPKEEAPTPTAAPASEQPTPQEQPAPQPVEQKPAAPEPASKTYLKAMPLKDLSDVENVKNEVRNGNIIILRITPLAGKSIEDVKTAVNDLFAFAEEIQGDIARLGEERVVICPKTIRIWREKTPAPVRDNQPLPTAA